MDSFLENRGTHNGNNGYNNGDGALNSERENSGRTAHREAKPVDLVFRFPNLETYIPKNWVCRRSSKPKPVDLIFVISESEKQLQMEVCDYFKAHYFTSRPLLAAEYLSKGMSFPWTDQARNRIQLEYVYSDPKQIPTKNI